MTSIAIIGARLNSSRLPGKHLRLLADVPLIERLVTRLQNCEKLDKIILATTADDFNQPLVEWAHKQIPVTVFDGDVNDLVGRIDSVVQKENPKHIVYICGDCPLIDPGFVDHSLTQLSQNPSKHKISLKDGIESIHEGVDIYSRAGWSTLVMNSTTDMTREHVGYANDVSPCLDVLEIDDSDDFSSINHRISVDTPADYDFMQTVYSRWYQTHPAESIVDLKWVQAELLRDEVLRSMNEHVHQKKPELQYQKVALFCHVSETIGLGHVKRCAIIAAALQENLGVGTTIYICGNEKPLPWLNSSHIWHHDNFYEMESNRDDCWVIDYHPDHIDTRQLVETVQEAKKDRDTNIVAIDKMNCLLDICDNLFLPAFFTPMNNPKISVGWDHYFLPSFPKVKKKKQLLVLTGGSDALGYGELLPQCIENIMLSDWQLIWVQGPYASAPNLDSQKRWQLLKNPDDLYEKMAESSIVLSCYGLSLFESMASGSFTVLLPPQHLCDDIELAELRKAEACLIIDSMDDVNSTLVDIENKNVKTEHYTRNSKRLFHDVDGAKKISALVKKLLE